MKIRNKNLLRGQKDWDEKKRILQKYSGKTLFRMDTKEGWQYAVLENEEIVYEIIKRSEKLIGVYGEI